MHGATLSGHKQEYKACCPVAITWGLISWSPQSSSFEDQAPVDFIYGCLIFKWVSLQRRDHKKRYHNPMQWQPANMPYCLCDFRKLQLIRNTSSGISGFGKNRNWFSLLSLSFPRYLQPQTIRDNLFEIHFNLKYHKTICLPIASY